MAMNNSEEEQKWFEVWFDSPYYHLLYQNRDDSEARNFLNNLLKKLNPGTGSKILDVACGKGRHAKYLNELGYNVTGIDLSAESIKQAKQFESDSLQFAMHDMRKPLSGIYFDLALNLFTSIGYFEDENDNLKTIQAISQMLHPGGQLVIDFMNSKKVLANMIEYETKKIDQTEFLITRSYTNDFIIKRIEIDGTNEVFEERVSPLTLDNFTSYFSKSGFELIHLFGDYNLNQFDENESDRLILVSAKTID